MRLMRSVVAGCALLFSIDALAPVQSDLTGYWKYAVPNGGVSEAATAQRPSLAR